MRLKEKLYDLITGVGINILDRIFPEYFGKEPLAPTDRHIEYPWAIRNLPKPPCEVLDIGCIGMFPLLLKAIGYSVKGFDIRTHPLESRFAFYQVDITNTRHWGKELFGCITAISTIEHIKDDRKAIDNIHRLLTPKGLFLMTVPFGKARQTRFHRIYDMANLLVLLKDFKIIVKVVDSPQEGQIALVKAVK